MYSYSYWIATVLIVYTQNSIFSLKSYAYGLASNRNYMTNILCQNLTLYKLLTLAIAIFTVDTRINETRSTMDRVNIISLQQLDTVELENKDRGTEDTVEPENKDRGTEDTVEPENKDRVTKEEKFWDELVGTTLKPESANLSKVEELKEKLKNLRNLSVLIIFLINVMWIVFLYTLVFPHLAKYNLPDKAFSLLFLFIFSILVLIQFFAMIFHRFKTMLHLLAGVRPRNNIAEVNVTAKGT